MRNVNACVSGRMDAKEGGALWFYLVPPKLNSFRSKNELIFFFGSHVAYICVAALKEKRMRIAHIIIIRFSFRDFGVACENCLAY